MCARVLAVLSERMERLSTCHPGVHVLSRVTGTLSPLMCPPVFVGGPDADEVSPSHRLLWYQHERVSLVLYVDFSSKPIGALCACAATSLCLAVHKAGMVWCLQTVTSPSTH
jgi:hypothetical protein